MEVIKKTVAKRVNKYYSSQPEDAIIRKIEYLKTWKSHGEVTVTV